MSRNAFFSSRSEKNIFFDVDIVVKKQVEMWLSVVYNLIDNDSEVKICCGQMMTPIVVYKSTDHAKPHSISTVSINTSSDNSCTTMEFHKVQSF